MFDLLTDEMASDMGLRTPAADGADTERFGRPPRPLLEMCEFWSPPVNRRARGASVARFMSGSRWLGRYVGCLALCVVACTPPPAPPKPAPAPVASQTPAAPKAAMLEAELEPGPVELRTGRIAPVDHKEALQLKVRRHALDGDEQLLEIVLPPRSGTVQLSAPANGRLRCEAGQTLEVVYRW